MPVCFEKDRESLTPIIARTLTRFVDNMVSSIAHRAAPVANKSHYSGDLYSALKSCCGRRARDRVVLPVPHGQQTSLETVGLSQLGLFCLDPPATLFASYFLCICERHRAPYRHRLPLRTREPRPGVNIEHRRPQSHFTFVQTRVPPRIQRFRLIPWGFAPLEYLFPTRSISRTLCS